MVEMNRQITDGNDVGGEMSAMRVAWVRQHPRKGHHTSKSRGCVALGRTSGPILGVGSKKE